MLPGNEKSQDHCDVARCESWYSDGDVKGMQFMLCLYCFDVNVNVNFAVRLMTVF